MELWNKNDISMPPNNSVKIKKEDIDIIHLKSVLNGALKAMEETHLLHTEAAFLSRFLFKMQRQFRGQKGIMYMYKVNRGLKRYLSLDLQYVYSNFCKTISCAEDINDEYVSVPTKQMLQYVLVRTQGFCKIMNYLSVACQDAAHYFKGIIQLGHLLRSCLFSLGLVSRIWFCARYFMICACQWYDQLLPYLEKLKTKGPCWLPTEYKFPENLSVWFGSNPITGELKYDIDVQKISEEISQTEAFRDEGIVVRREDFMKLKQKRDILQNESSKMSSINQKGKLFAKDLSAELMVNNMNFTSDIGTKPIENCAKDFNDQEVENKSVIVTKNASNSLSLRNDFGEKISRDQFLAQKNKKKNVSRSSCEDSEDVTKKTFGDNQKLLSENVENDSGESCAVLNRKSVISKKEKNTQLKKGLQSLLKLNKLKSPTSKVISAENVANEGRETNVADKYISFNTSTDTFCSSDVPHGMNKKLVFKDDSDLKVLNDDITQKSIDTLLNCKQEENKTAQSSKTVNDNKGVAGKLQFESNAEQISDVNEYTQQCAINSASKKKKKNSLGNWEIINGIRTLKDVEEFLLREKKARRKGKSCVTSQLNNSEWVVLFDSISKHLKKNEVSRLKGKRLKNVMEEIRNTLISFVI